MENGDYRGMSDRKWRLLAAFQQKKAGHYGFWDNFERDLSSEEFAKGIADLMSDDSPVGSKEAPAWHSTLDGLPTDRDVWAFLAVYDDKDEVELIRGRADGRTFLPAGGDGWDDRDVADIICWSAADERPEISLAIVKACVAALERIEHRGHGHPVEDWLHREALRAVVAGHPDAQAIAAAALESRAVKFTRYYS